MTTCYSRQNRLSSADAGWCPQRCLCGRRDRRGRSGRAASASCCLRATRRFCQGRGCIRQDNRENKHIKEVENLWHWTSESGEISWKLHTLLKTAAKPVHHLPEDLLLAILDHVLHQLVLNLLRQFHPITCQLLMQVIMKPKIAQRVWGFSKSKNDHVKHIALLRVPVDDPVPLHLIHDSHLHSAVYSGYGPCGCHVWKIFKKVGSLHHDEASQGPQWPFLFVKDVSADA